MGRLFRTVGLSNFAVRIETGPGVSPATEADTQGATLLSECEILESSRTPAPPTPAPTQASTPAPTKKNKKRKCKRVCKTSALSWTKKCNWRKCRGCSKCKASRRMQAAIEVAAFMTGHILV